MGSEASLTSQLYDLVRNDILRGALEPGSKLPIDMLKEKYGAGASAVREALSLLTSDELVERIDHRGFRVSPIGRDGFEQLHKARCWVEVQALRESIRHGDVAWEEGVILANYHLQKSARAASTDRLLSQDEWEQRHRTFHLSLLTACQSDYLVRFCDHMYNLNVRYRRIVGVFPAALRRGDQEHEAIVEAALSRDEDKAAELLLNHYELTASYIRQYLDSL